MIRRHVVVHGGVQGVSFRDGLRREARRAGVRGWVTNRADGTVEVEFEGDEAAVTDLCEWCRHGPAAARVERVDITEETPHGGTESFEVR